MQIAKITSILTALFVVGLFSSRAQVYSVHVGSTVGGGTLVYQLDHDWVIGTPPNRFGLVQYRSRNGSSTALITYTTVHFASRQFTVQVPAWAVASIGVLACSSMVLLALTIRIKT